MFLLRTARAFYLLGTKIADAQKQQVLFKLYLFFLFTIYPAMCSMSGESIRGRAHPT